MRFLLLAGSACVLFASAARAQLLLYPKTKTNIGVFTRDGSSTDVQFVAMGTGYQSERVATATGAGVAAGTRGKEFLFARGFRFREFGYVDASAASAAAVGTTVQTSASGLMQGPHVYEMSVRGQATANLVITTSGSVAGNGRAKIDIDIDSDNTVDYSYSVGGAAQRRVFANFRGGAPRLVSITVDAAASGPGSSYDFTMLMNLENTLRGRCHFARFGSPCGTLTLDGIDAVQTTSHDLTINANSGVPNAPSLLFLGVTRVRVPVAGALCPLFTLPLVTVPPTTSDAAGNTQFFLRVPSPLVVQDVLWQAVNFRATGGFLLGNGLEMDCL